MGPILLILMSAEVWSQELSTPRPELKSRTYSFDTQQFLNGLNRAEPTKQGPVLFPNDAPPPPRPPLVVTARPLAESIARSDQANNTVTSPSQINAVSFVPFLARVKDYRPYVPSPPYNYHFVPTQVPYADIVKKTRYNSLERDHRYNDYEEQTLLPPIYKALSEHAKHNVLKTQDKNLLQKIQPSYVDPHSNDINDQNNEYDQNQNYAFSYTVKDKKTGDDFSHSQHSSGSATNGEYRVRLPDGRMQIVSYTADENGYKADVRYDDENVNNIDHGIADNTRENSKDFKTNDRYNFVSPTYNAHEKIYTNHGVADNTRQNLKDFKSNFDDKYNFVTPTYNYDSNYVTPTQNYLTYNADYNRNDYLDRSVKGDYGDVGKKENDKQDFYVYPDVSKEYYNDYSAEYNTKVEPHRSKFGFVNKNLERKASVTPSYEELKDLFVTKNLYNTQQNYNFDLSTTPLSNDATTERIVLIGNKTPNLYTNINQSLLQKSAISYATPKVVVATTPQSYLASTIASLRNKVHLAKPVLSESFINRINKYISFK